MAHSFIVSILWKLYDTQYNNDEYRRQLIDDVYGVCFFTADAAAASIFGTSIKTDC